MDDRQIIALFFACSEQAVAELSGKYGAVCRRVAENILNDRLDAEEVVNDAYLGVWNTVPPQQPDPLLRYVCRIVRNLALKKYPANTARKRNSSVDPSGQLERKVESITAAFFSPATSSFSIGGTCAVFRYTFDAEGRLTGQTDTGSTVPCRR